MTAGQTIEKLFNACRVAGVDPDLIFQHYDDADIREYGRAMGEGWIPEDDLPRWMASTERTIREGRCLCWTCLRERGFA